MFKRRAPTQQRSKDTVEAIFEGAIRELQRGTTAKVSVNRIAEVAGVSVGSLYQYFPSKNALLTALLTRFVRRRFDAIFAMIAQLEEEERTSGVPTSLEDVMTRLVEGTFALAADRPALERALVAWFVRVGDLESLRAVDEECAAKLAHALALLERPPTRIRPLDRNAAAWVLLHSIRTVMLTMMLGHGAFDRAALTHEVTQLAIRYLRPDPH